MRTDAIRPAAVRATECAVSLTNQLRATLKASAQTLPGLRSEQQSGVARSPDDLGPALSNWRYAFPGMVRQLKRSVSELELALDNLSAEDHKAVLRLMLADHESTGFGRFDPVAWRVHHAHRLAEYVLLCLRDLDVPGLQDADVPHVETGRLTAELDIAIAATETKLKTPDDVNAERKTAIWATEGVINTLVSESDLDALRHQLQRDGSVLAVAEETQPANLAGQVVDVAPAGSPDQPAEGGADPQRKPLRLSEVLAFKAAQLAESIAGEKLTDEETHEKLKHDPVTEAALSADPDLKDYDVPDEPRTFARYLSTARTFFGCPRKMPTRGRTGRSLVRLDGSRSDQ